MKLLIDESCDARLCSYLNDSGHDATSIAVDHPQALSDDDVLVIAVREQRALITDDGDVGDLIIRQQRPHCGLIAFTDRSAIVRTGSASGPQEAPRR